MKKARCCKNNGCTNKHRAKGLCAKHYNAIRYVANREKFIAGAVARYNANKWHYKAVKRAWYLANKERIKIRVDEHFRTFEGLISSMYSNMKTRVTSLKQKPHHIKLYYGRYLPPRSEFIEFASSSLDMHRLYKQWVASGYETDLRPSPDRTSTTPDPKTGFTGGYELHNIRFVTWKMNRELARAKREQNAKKIVYALAQKTLNVPGRTQLTKNVPRKQKQAVYNVVNMTNGNRNEKRKKAA